MRISTPETGDAEAMSRIVKSIIAATGRDRPGDVAFFLSTYKRETVALLESSGRPLMQVATDVGIPP